MQSSHEDQSFQTADHAPENEHADGIESMDPFALWAAEAPTGPSGQRPSARPTKTRSRSTDDSDGPRFGRRKLVTLLAAGTAGVITVVTVGGISFARSPQLLGQPPAHVGDDGSISTIPQKDVDKDGDGTGKRKWDNDGDDKRPIKKPKPPHKPTATQSPTPTKTPTSQPSPPTPQPTKMPSPTATPPGHTGTVIGSTTQATNSAVAFTNPTDGQGSLLVRLSNGNWVACERACTHQQAWVNYDTTSGQLVCPAHGAIFDPLNGCSHVSGPGSGPLTHVTIRINTDGTITTG